MEEERLLQMYLPRSEGKEPQHFLNVLCRHQGGKNSVWTEGDAVSSTRADAKQPCGDSGSETLVLELSFCAWRAALAWHTQGGVTPCPNLGPAEVSSCGCRGGPSCGSGHTSAAQLSNCTFPWPGGKLQSALLSGNSFC